MAFDLGAVIAHIKADVTDFQSKMSTVKSNVDQTKKRFEGLGDQVKGFAQSASLITAGIGAGLGLFLKSSSDAASDFTKNMITLDIIAERFGQSGHAAQMAAKSLGEELRIGVGPAANGIQNLLKSGLNLDQATDLMKRFTNEAITGKSESISLGQAVENLSFAFATGNSALGNMSGISENWSDIMAKGKTVLEGWNGSADESIGITEELAGQIKNYEELLKKQGKTLSASDDEQTKYIGLLQLTNLTLGSSERFQGTFIDNMAQMQLGMTNMKLAAGQLVQTALNPLVMWFNSSGIFQNIERFLTVLNDIATKLIAFASGASYAREELAQALTFFTGGDFEKANKIAAFLEGIVTAFQNLGNWIAENQEIVNTFLTGLAIGFGAILLVAPLVLLAMNPFVLTFTAIALAIAGLYTAWQTNFLGIQTVTSAVVNVIVWVFQNILIPAFKAIWNWIENSFVPAFIGFFNAIIKPQIIAWTEWFRENWDNIKLMIEGVWKIISGIIQIAWNTISGLLIVGLQLLSGDWKGAWETIKSITSNNWEAIKRIFSGIVDFIKGWGGTILNALKKPFEDAWERIKKIVEDIKGALDFTQRHSPSVVDIVENGVNKVNSALSGIMMPQLIQPQATFSGLAAAMTPETGMMAQQPLTIMNDFDGAIISDEAGAERIGEIVGDGIIRKLQSNVRF